MSEERYRHVARYVFETPWAILPATFEIICELIDQRIAGHRLTAEEIEARIGAGPARRPMAQAGAVQILPLYGVITPRETLMSKMSGATSLDTFSAQLADAVANPSVAQILLDVDSPGGNVEMVTEVAAQIREGRKAKPITAVANTMAASAAYHLASQATELVGSPSGLVGSIGVISQHDDLSAAAEQIGLKRTYVTAGKYKAEGNPMGPLDDEALAARQQLVDDAYGLMVSDIAKGRGVPVEAVRGAQYGEGRVLSMRRALDAGMVDRVDTFQNVLAGMLRGRTPATSRAELDDDDQAPELEPELAAAVADDQLLSHAENGQPPAGSDDATQAPGPAPAGTPALATRQRRLELHDRPPIGR